MKIIMRNSCAGRPSPSRCCGSASARRTSTWSASPSARSATRFSSRRSRASRTRPSRSIRTCRSLSVSSDYDLNKQFDPDRQLHRRRRRCDHAQRRRREGHRCRRSRGPRRPASSSRPSTSPRRAPTSPCMTDNVKAGTLACQYIVDTARRQGQRADRQRSAGRLRSSTASRAARKCSRRTPDIKSSRRIRTPRARATAAWPSRRPFDRYPQDRRDLRHQRSDRHRLGARRQAAAPRRIHHHRGRWRARHRSGAEDRQVDDQGLVLAGPLHDGRHGAGTRREGLKGEKIQKPVVLLDPVLITSENLKDYKGWTAR